jgi:hypothetical protein
MQFRTFITAAAGTAVAVALATQVFAQAAGGKEKESYETRTRSTECEWTATTTHGVDTVRLRRFGNPPPESKIRPVGITHVELPGGDPSTLTLVLTAVAPTGIEPQHVTPTPVEYQQTFVLPKDRAPAKVTIFEAAATVQVNAP